MPSPSGSECLAASSMPALWLNFWPSTESTDHRVLASHGVAEARRIPEDIACYHSCTVREPSEPFRAADEDRDIELAP
jgi:hypothetical protein